MAGDLSQGGATFPFSLAWKGEAIRLVVKLSNQGGKGAATVISGDQLDTGWWQSAPDVREANAVAVAG
jgi:hypothetical protein